MDQYEAVMKLLMEMVKGEPEKNAAVRDDGAIPQLPVCGITMERREGLHPKPKNSERGIPMTKFSHVIIRRPGKSLCNGITSAPELGQPIYNRAIEEHYDYEHALEQCGVDVTVLPALEEYPDSCFVEDPAVITRCGAIITNPGADSRNALFFQKLHVVG